MAKPLTWNPGNFCLVLALYNRGQNTLSLWALFSLCENEGIKRCLWWKFFPATCVIFVFLVIKQNCVDFDQDLRGFFLWDSRRQREPNVVINGIGFGATQPGFEYWFPYLLTVLWQVANLTVFQVPPYYIGDNLFPWAIMRSKKVNIPQVAEQCLAHDKFCR